MPFRHLANTDAQRLSALDAAFIKWTGSAPADRLLTDVHFAKLDLGDANSLYSVFKRDVGESSAALAKQGQLTDANDAKNAALAQVTSHFIQVFNFAVARGTFARSDRAFYGLDMNQADVPPMSSHADIQLWAGKLVTGEAARLAATPGAVPMAMPPISAVALAQVEGLEQSHSEAKDVYDKEQADVAADRGPIDALLLDMWDTIEFNLRTLDGPSRRRRAREWGVVYLTRPDEPADPPAGAPATPPPASP